MIRCLKKAEEAKIGYRTCSGLLWCGTGKNKCRTWKCAACCKGESSAYYERLEPEIKVFCFEKATGYYDELSEAEQEEEKINMRNGINFARKVLTTRECDMLILDEVLGLVDNGIVSVEELELLIREKEDDVDLILTGRVLKEEIRPYVDEIYNITSEK